MPPHAAPDASPVATPSADRLDVEIVVRGTPGALRTDALDAARRALREAGFALTYRTELPIAATIRMHRR